MINGNGINIPNAWYVVKQVNIDMVKNKDKDLDIWHQDKHGYGIGCW